MPNGLGKTDRREQYLQAFLALSPLPCPTMASFELPSPAEAFEVVYTVSTAEPNFLSNSANSDLDFSKCWTMCLKQTSLSITLHHRYGLLGVPDFLKLQSLSISLLKLFSSLFQLGRGILFSHILGDLERLAEERRREGSCEGVNEKLE
jgi:hypothetical protein